MSLGQAIADWLTTRLNTWTKQLRGEKKAAYWKGYEDALMETRALEREAWEQKMRGLGEKPDDWLAASLMAAGCGVTTADINHLAINTAKGLHQ